MFTIRTDSQVVNCGISHSMFCANCAAEKDFDLILKYTCFQLNFVFRFITDKDYLLLCRKCGHGLKFDSKKVESSLAKVPIPFFDRYGGFLVISIILFFSAIAVAVNFMMK